MIEVLYWNCANGKERVAQALHLEAQYDIVAIQEPARDRHGDVAFPGSSNYILVSQQGCNSRAVSFVHRRLDRTSWSHEEGKDWVAIHFQTETGPVSVFNVYSPIPLGNTWMSPVKDWAGQEPPHNKVVIVGDFNAHHPVWDSECDQISNNAETVLRLAEKWGLSLASSPDEITRVGKPRERHSVIDLAWASHDLQVNFLGAEGVTGSDHIPMTISIDPGATVPLAQAEGWSWKRMKADKIGELIREKLPETFLTSDLTEGGEPLHPSRMADILLEVITEVANEAVPKRKAPGEGFQPLPYWNAELDELRVKSRAARREYFRTREREAATALREINRAIRRECRKASNLHWRALIRTAAETAAGLPVFWKIERWARLRSHSARESTEVPALTHPVTGEVMTDHEGKADALAAKFFPCPPADLSDIPDEDFGNIATWPVCPFEINMEVDEADVKGAMGRNGKAPGADRIPFAMLRAGCDQLARLIADLAEHSLCSGQYPGRFKEADTVVIPKPGKTREQKKTPGGWRPIALLPTVGKIIERIMAERIAKAAEDQGLLPQGQMGNRALRSTELAVRWITQTVQTAWRHGAVASLLQLDIAGAFDTVNHKRLLHILRQMGFPVWVVLWVKDWLTGRTATLRFDGKKAAPRPVRAGVPQGSPLSPILFILYISSLYQELEDIPGLVVIGFADDTNIIAFSYDITENRRRL